MNDELNKEDTPNSSEDEPASLRVENEANDDATVDSSSVDVAACKKKNKPSHDLYFLRLRNHACE